MRVSCFLLIYLFLQTGTPAVAFQSLQEQLASQAVEKLVADAEKFGDAARGASAFYLPEMNCAKCHEATASGRRLGPDLFEKREVTYQRLIESILHPSKQIKEGYESAIVQMIDGRILTGVLVEANDTSLSLDQIEQPDKPLVIDLDDVDDWKKTKTSSMPSDLANQLTDRQQFLDLVCYLKAVADGGPAVASQLRPALLAINVPLPEYESRVDHRTLISELGNRAYGRGETTYSLRCASCHGTLEEEGSMPTSLRFAAGKFKHGNDPYTMYRTLTHGFGMMNPQTWMVPRQKYDVIHYVREHFLKDHNPDQHFEVTDEYMAGLPEGNTLGPEPVVSRPWSDMAYGPSLNNTIEVSNDGSNIAQKGIAIRLDDGPGGVESGKYWMMYEHDTMRMAAAWSGSFINYEGIHFNGMHGRHPKVSGDVQIENPVAPGWGRPRDGSFADDHRILGRDLRRYGPLPREWSAFKGLYRFGKQTILDYQVGKTTVLESPGLRFVNERPVYLRHLNIGSRDRDLVLQVARAGAGQTVTVNESSAIVQNPENLKTGDGNANDILKFNGDTFAQSKPTSDFDMHKQDFTIWAEIKAEDDGTIFSQTKDQQQWIKGGKSFFIQDQRLCFDIGWVGVLKSEKPIPMGKWVRVAMTWRAEDGRTEFFVDGQNIGTGELPSRLNAKKTVQRIGLTNKDFPQDAFFRGQIKSVRFFQRALEPKQLGNIQEEKAALVGDWNLTATSAIEDQAGGHDLDVRRGAASKASKANGLLVKLNAPLEGSKWIASDNNIRLRIPAGEPVKVTVQQFVLTDNEPVDQSLELATPNLKQFTKGGSKNWPQVLETRMSKGQSAAGFRVDVLTRPIKNPWNDRLRLTGIDFLPESENRDAIISTWDGSIWRVSGVEQATADSVLKWQRIAAGLFQPLGVKIRDGEIFIVCRDQIVRLHDLNGDREIDWYENFNSDHQVTEHFHEFAMGLQTDDEGNFYYAKSARHAKKAVVPHHGTLLKVAASGETTEIVANGFRAANGVCINPDGTFIVTDQEGHWNPKNRINWVSPGGFYGNMFGYHDVTDSSDEAMDDPLCWITNNFDRSPAELLWVDSDKWGPLNGSLLNFSYGFGQVYIVPHEKIGDQMQGGMVAFPFERFPTGVMRGRFHPVDGQLYCCGMFAWSGTQQQPGGLYRINYTGEPVHVPIGLKAKKAGVEIGFSGALDAAAANEASNYAVKIWDLKRTKEYGSAHYNERALKVSSAELSEDGKTVFLAIPDIQPTWGMEIVYSLKSREGERVTGKIHNTIHQLGD